VHIAADAFALGQRVSRMISSLLRLNTACCEEVYPVYTAMMPKIISGTSTLMMVEFA